MVCLISEMQFNFPAQHSRQQHSCASSSAQSRRSLFSLPLRAARPLYCISTEYNKRKISCEFEKCLTSGLPTANSQEMFLLLYLIRICTRKKCIEQCFHTRSESTLLNRKCSIDLTLETLRPGRNLKTLSYRPEIFFSGKLEGQLGGKIGPRANDI